MNPNCVVEDPHGASPTQMILSTALGRWLNVAEIETLLNPNTTVLALSTSPPSNPPPSGTLLLYNRSVTRNYKDDGYKWIKKRNSHKVREDHVKLRVGGKFRVSGCYVHGATNLSLHRRAYHLLNPETGTALYPVSNSNSRNNMPSLVLVHYLDTKVASQYSANMMIQRNINAADLRAHEIERGNRVSAPSPVPTINSQQQIPIHSNSLRSISLPASASSSIASNNFVPRKYSHPLSPSPTAPTIMRTTQSNMLYNYAQSAKSDSLSNKNIMNDINDMSLSPHCANYSDSISSSMLGVETLDFLWDVLFKEGEDKLEETLANGNYLVNPSMIQEMLDAKETGANDECNKNKESPETQSVSEETRSVENNTIVPCNHGNISEMATIIDMTPNQTLVDKTTNVVISCDDPISFPGGENENQNSNFAWHTLAAFVAVTKEISTNCPKTVELNLFPAKKLNPYACKVQIPPSNLDYNRHVIIVSVFLDSGMNPMCKGIAASIGLVLEQSWNEQMETSNNSSKSWLHLSSTSQSAVEDRPFIRLLTQMSEEQFSFTAPNTEELCLGGHNQKDFCDRKDSINDLPAPAPHMAMVATALSDFPNPPVKAVLPPTTTMSFTGPNDKQETKTLYELTDESPETKRMIQASMEATVDDNDRNSKKRPNSSIEVGPSSIDDVPVAASAWASKPSNIPQSDTKAEEVDRHCKIRFVEKLNDVIAEAEPGAAVNDDKLKNMDDEELDNILDDLLVRIVESLVEISASSCEIQEELNIPDKSGFALLHYAALYNLPSLIPVLLSRGANPDIQTSRGNLTPLHLACGAGNAAIAELLVRNGCALHIPDCFGSYPVDHAIRNGFTNVAEYLQSQILKEKALRNASMESSSHTTIKAEDMQNGSNDYEQEKFLLQSAFSNLSLKDKLIFNMMVRKRGRAKNSENQQKNPIIKEEDDLSSKSDDSCSMEMMGASVESMVMDENDDKKGKKVDKNRQSWENDSVDTVITDTDKESLNIAMKLMNNEELEDIQKKSADDNEDLREWMLKRNYESLMEASQHLKKTMTKHGENKKKSSENDGKSSGNKAATVRSLKNMKNQALAGLVIRKNVIKRKKPPEKNKNTETSDENQNEKVTPI